MPPNILKYSNGWGHLVMSIVLIAAGIILILQPGATVQAVGIGLIGSVVPYWFISSSANAQQHGATQVQITPAPMPITITAPLPTDAPGGQNGSTNQQP